MVGKLNNMEYPGFDIDIKDAFQEIIEKYNFQFPVGDYSKIYNDKCALIFIYDRGEIACKVSPDDRNYYSLGSIFLYFYPSSNWGLTSKGVWPSPREQLFQYADILSNKLEFILQGDFAWIGGYLEEENSVNKMIKYVRTDLSRDHPIYQKFIKEDPSWQDDLEKYLMENNINL